MATVTKKTLKIKYTGYKYDSTNNAWLDETWSKVISVPEAKANADLLTGSAVTSSVYETAYGCANALLYDAAIDFGSEDGSDNRPVYVDGGVAKGRWSSLDGAAAHASTAEIYLEVVVDKDLTVAA